MKRFISLLIALTLLLGVLCGCAGRGANTASGDAAETQTDAAGASTEAKAETDPVEQTDAPTDSDETHITFRVTHEDGELKEFELSTSKTTLAEVLIDENLVGESASPGLYDTVDGELADWNDNEAWWCFYCDGEMLMVGINETELVDGAVYEAVFTHGFN